MSLQQPSNYAEWYQGLGGAIPSVFGGPIGQLDGKCAGTIIDQQIALLKAGVKAHMPDYAPPDALQHIGADRNLIQGASESNASFVVRCKTHFDTAARMGTPCGVLEQLWYYGLTNAVWVQPNGLYDTFGNSTLTPGQDPTSLLQVGNTSPLSTPFTSSLTPPSTTAAGRSVPSGTPWIAFDSNTDLTNRFAIVLPSLTFSALSFAVFNNSDSATVVWPFTFNHSSYNVMYGAPTAPVVLSNDGTAQTFTQTVIRASAPWTGTVAVIGWVNGTSPFNYLSTASFGQIKSIISTYRPNAICMGVFLMQGDRMWDWPAAVTWDGYGGQWDSGNVISQLIGTF